jgi:hypothetical protein
MGAGSSAPPTMPAMSPHHSVSVGTVMGIAKLAWSSIRWTARTVGLMARPHLREPTEAPSNLPSENHLLWNVPVEFGWGLRDPHPYTVFLRWNGDGYQLVFSGERAPRREVVLPSPLRYVVPVVIRSLIGEPEVRLSTEPGIFPIEAPKGIARLVDLNSFWGMAGPRVDFPPGRHWVTIELRDGANVIPFDYELRVPEVGENNAGFRLWSREAATAAFRRERHAHGASD